MVNEEILFFDPNCQKPYSARTLMEEALGGTEASVARIAETLGARVMQHNRGAPDGRFLPPAPSAGIKHLVILRDPRTVQAISARYPGARVYLWVHDLMRPGGKRGRRLAASAATLAELAVTVVCVSDFQRRQVEAVLARVPAGRRVRAVTIYNPVDDRLAPDGSPVDAGKLVFFSSPNKGLAFALDAFQAARRSMPDLHLRVGSPGYKSLRRARMQSVEGGIDGVEWLGALPQARILAEVRTALCVFYPNFVLPETFGLVLAEAKAVGTPVLTHDCGAAGEVLDDPRQTLPIARSQRLYERAARSIPSGYRRYVAPLADRLGVFDAYVERVRAWRNGARPHIGPDARFRLSAVAERWRALFARQIP
ncbi:MAG TPA: glycosyltransferase family 4 protein [Steroidobacteraceae bacterium]|nr:glycosyltransferase family 4 protein [Steroidobacteraceae bacterium]